MWIRPGSDVAYRPRRRAVSAPDDFNVRVSRHDFDSAGAGTGRARTIASYATEDSDAIAALSKRNDREFLHGVAAKMASLTSPSTYSQPTRNSHSSLPPTYRKSVPTQSSPSSNYLRRAAVLTPEDNLEIASYLQRTPWSATTGGYRRSASVPPLGLSGSVRPSVPKWYPSSAAYYGRSAARTPGGVASWTSGPGYQSLPPRPPTGERLDSINDSVVGVAHTALYGDIVIGIPYKKRFMYSVQRELDDLETPAAVPRGVQQLRVGSVPPSAAHFVKTRPGSIALPNGYQTVNLAKPYSRASYAGPGSYTINTRSPPTIYRAPPDASDFDDVVSIKSYPGAVVRGRSVTSTSNSRYPRTAFNVIENDADFENTDAINQLTALKRDARSMLSRYSLPPVAPSNNGPKHFTSSELDQKYGQILSSMQAQQRVRPQSEYNYSTLTLPGAERKARRPEMSETRRKLRELLCRSRNDPHYFDN